MIVAYLLVFLVPTRVKSQNAHHCCHAIRFQEVAWGATSQYKDGWQEDSVRDVTSEVKDRARKLPEALYASWRSVQEAVDFWTSPLRGQHRLALNKSITVSAEPRHFTCVDDWGPADDSRGRCVQSGKRILRDETQPERGSLHERIRSIVPGRTPTTWQCQAILKVYFREHEFDPDLVAWEAIWNQEKRYASWELGRDRGRMRGGQMAEPIYEVDYNDEVTFEMYHSFKLGEGSSIVGDSMSYTRSETKDNSWFRHTAYKDNDTLDSDRTLDYSSPFRSDVRRSPGSATIMMKHAGYTWHS